MNKYHRLFKIAYTLTAVLLTTLLLVSCDGGGGGGNSDKIDSGNNGNGADGNDNSSIYPISMAAAGDSITVTGP